MNLDDDKNDVIGLFLHNSFQDVNSIPHIKGSSYKSIHTQSRETHQTALTGKNKNKSNLSLLFQIMFSKLCDFLDFLRLNTNFDICIHVF